MDRVNNIISNRRYRELLGEIEELEKERIYCHHGMEHNLDVARIAAMMAADEGIDVQRDIVYAAALIHDIGRKEQYIHGVEHEIASAAIAPLILEECGYTDDEIDMIIAAIINHGNEAVRDEENLTGLIYRADKASRKCYLCKAADTCHKPEEKRVKRILY